MTSGPPLLVHSAALAYISNTAIQWSTSFATATNFFPDGVKLIATIPFCNGALKLQISSIVSESQTNMFGLAPNSPEATVLLSTGFKSIAVISS